MHEFGVSVFSHENAAKPKLYIEKHRQVGYYVQKMNPRKGFAFYLGLVELDSSSVSGDAKWYTPLLS